MSETPEQKQEMPVSIAVLLASLPEEERVILTLHYLKGLSPDQIATALAVPLRAVETVITVGKKRLISVFIPPQ